MQPFSIALHYGEGDSVPLSHVLPLYQHMYDFAHDLDSFQPITDFMKEEEERDAVATCVRERWIGSGRKVGLHTDVHALAFVLDPFAQASQTTPEKPICDLITGETVEAARAALRHFSNDDPNKRAVLMQQFMLWNAAAPRLPNEGSAQASDHALPRARATGNNGFSSLRLDAMYQVWDKMKARAATQIDGECDTESSGFAMRETVAKLRLCSSPVEFWLAMVSETPRGASSDQKEAHMLFCKSAANFFNWSTLLCTAVCS